jgi:hypothetical protein
MCKGDKNEKLFWNIVLALVFVLPAPTMARVSVNVGISLPPIVFGGPPELVVIPETNVYAVPDVDADIFSMAAGGGVHGKGNGTARITMIRVGDTIGGVHLFIEAYPPVGGMTTGKIVGKGINGINKEYPTSKFNKTGETGKKQALEETK